jgi:aspartyl-tRNA synthetase
MVFFVLREKFDTVQAILSINADTVSKQMLKWSGSISAESIVLVEAELVAPKELVKSCSIQDVELKVLTIHQESASENRLPFTLEDASTPDVDGQSRVNLDTKLDNRIIDLRVGRTLLKAAPLNNPDLTL